MLLKTIPKNNSEEQKINVGKNKLDWNWKKKKVEEGEKSEGW